MFLIQFYHTYIINKNTNSDDSHNIFIDNAMDYLQCTTEISKQQIL